MNDTRVNGSAASQSSPQSSQRDATTASRLAESILSTNGRGAVRDTDGIKRDLDQVAARNPALGAQVRALVEQGLTPVERGQLVAANDVTPPSVAQTVTAPDNQPITFTTGAPSIAERFAAPAGSPSRAFYDRLDRIWGDGNPATNDVAKIDAGLADLYRSGQTIEQVEATRTATTQPQGTGQPQGAGFDLRLAADLTQIGLDIVGIFEPTPFADLTNGAISLGRGIYDGISNGSWTDFGMGVGNAAISVAGVLPYAGDTAKLLRLGKHADTVVRAIDAAMSSPAARAALEPGLRAIKDGLDAIPAGALDSLPQSAADAIRGMKTKIDEFFAAGSRAALRNADGSLNIDNAAARYAEVVGSNRPWSWADNFGGPFTSGERSQIREVAISQGLIPNVTLKSGTRYPDFAAAGLINRVDTLPANLWHSTDAAQFRWLDSRIPGGRPEGMTWHHSEIAGRMELVPFGPHNTINHIGGRSPGHWAHAPR